MLFSLRRRPPSWRVPAVGALLILGSLSASAQEIALDGVKIIGANRSALISVDGHQTRVREGDPVAGWVVRLIDSRMVVLANGAGEVKELGLHARFSLADDEAAERSTMPRDDDPDAEPAVIAPPPGEKVGEGRYHITPKFVEDDEIPEGYVRKRTPFGDFLIKKEHADGG